MTTPTLPTASLIKRFAAMVYDSLLVMAVAMGYGALFIGIKYSVFNVDLPTGERATIGTAGFVGLILVIEAFFWFFWCRGGQTLGMRAWRLQLRQDNGQFVSLPQAMVRGLIAPLSLAAFGLGYWWRLWDKEGRTWHDMASGTRMVQLPKQKK